MPRSVTRQIYTVHGGLQMTKRIFTFFDAFFQLACTCASIGNTFQNYNSRPEAPIFKLSSSLFIRHYLRNPIWFIFHRLLICLNSAGFHASLHVKYSCVAIHASRITTQYELVQSPRHHIVDDTFRQARVSIAKQWHTCLTNLLPKHSAFGKQLTLNQAYLQAYPEGANYVQTSVGSRNSAIHNAYRILLHSSSSIELRHSLQKHMLGIDISNTRTED